MTDISQHVSRLFDNPAMSLLNATSSLLNKTNEEDMNGITTTTESSIITTAAASITTPRVVTTTMISSTATNATTATINATTILSSTTNATTSVPDGAGSSLATMFISIIIFIVAIALIIKIILSNRKKRSELIGSARWRIATSQQSGAGPARTAASYAPMNNRGRSGGLDSTGPGEAVVDWERQFFDDTEPTIIPSRLQLNVQREDEY